MVVLRDVRRGRAFRGDAEWTDGHLMTFTTALPKDDDRVHADSLKRKFLIPPALKHYFPMPHQPANLRKCLQRGGWWRGKRARSHIGERSYWIQRSDG